METELELWVKYRSVPKDVIEEITIEYYFQNIRYRKQSRVNFNSNKSIIDFDKAVNTLSRTKKMNIIKKLIKNKAIWEYRNTKNKQFDKDEDIFVKNKVEEELKKEYIDLIYNTKPE